MTAFVLAAIFIALAAATIAGAVLSGGDDEGSKPSSADNTPAKPKADANKKQQQKEEPAAKKEPKDEPAAAAPAEEPAPAQEEPTASYDPARGAALNERRLRPECAQGDYAGAVPILQEAVKLFPPDSDGHQLRIHALQPRKVATAGWSARLRRSRILEKRLQWSPNQADTVQRELDLARQQAGQG